MHISLVGINHQTAPVNIREKVTIGAVKRDDSLSLLRAYVPHGVILSTCNRTEIYGVDGNPQRLQKATLDFLEAQTGISRTELLQHAYLSSDKSAAEHLFRVACGLESMIVGEFEVLGQVRQALETAEKAGMVTLPLRYLFQSAIRAGRLVRDETSISKNPLSVSAVAVDLAETVVKDLKDSRFLIIGAGEAGRLVAKVATERGASQLVVASRTHERASALASTMGGKPIDLSHMLGEELSKSNIVVTCADAPHWILTVNRIKEAMSKHPEGRPLVIIDIAVPRNVEPAVKQIKNVFLYNIDDLTEIARTNRKAREGEVKKAEEIVAAEVDKFALWWRTLNVRPVVGALMSKAEEIRAAQLAKTCKKLRPLSSQEQEDLESMTRSIVTKILQGPVHYLKTNADGNGNHDELVSEIFQLESNHHE